MKRMDKLDENKLQLISSINEFAEQANKDVRLLHKYQKHSDQLKDELTRAGKTVIASQSDTDLRHQDIDAYPMFLHEGEILLCRKKHCNSEKSIPANLDRDFRS